MYKTLSIAAIMLVVASRASDASSAAALKKERLYGYAELAARARLTI